MFSVVLYLFLSVQFCKLRRSALYYDSTIFSFAPTTVKAVWCTSQLTRLEQPIHSHFFFFCARLIKSGSHRMKARTCFSS
jgi:hypothetical protein